MTYYINNIPRLRLFFDTPNQLAVALVMSWGVVLYYISCNKYKPANGIKKTALSEIALHLGLFSVMAVLLVCLQATYSRSGMVVFMAVAYTLSWARGARRWVVISLIICASCLVFMPEAGERFTRIEPFEDKSISHRFDVWRGTLAMSLEMPWMGYGAYDFGEMLTTWYLPVNGSSATYVTAVSTPLTILGFLGYPALFAYLWGWLLLLIVGIRALFLENKGATACFIIQVAFLVGGFFAELHQSWILNIILMASICGTVGFHIKDAPAMRPFYIRWCAKAAVSSALLCGLLAGGSFLLFSEGYFLRRILLDTSGKTTGQGWTLAPKKPNGSQLVWIVSHDNVREHARSLCRPLAGQGWEVVILKSGAGEILTPEAGIAFLQYADSTFSTKSFERVVGGLGEDGLSALALASRLSQERNSTCKTVLVNVESYWPFDEFNPQKTIKTANCPLILAYGNNTTHYSQAAGLLADMGRKSGKQVNLLPLDASEEKELLVLLRKNLSCGGVTQDFSCTSPAIQNL